MPDQQVNVGGAPVTQGPAGFWLDADGNVAATDPQGNPQETPGMRDNPSSKIYYDAAKDLNYNIINGKKLYQSPAGVKPGSKGSGHGMNNPGSSLLKTGGTWNPESGTFDQGTNWSNILSMVVAGVLTAGAAQVIMGGAAPAAEAAAAGVPEASIPVAEGVGTSMAGVGAAGAEIGGATGAGATAAGVLPSTALGTGATELTAGAVPTGMTATGGVGSAVASALKNSSTAQKIADIFGAAGKGVGDATTAAGNNALDQEKLALDAARLNAGSLLGIQDLNARTLLGTQDLNQSGLLTTQAQNEKGTIDAADINLRDKLGTNASNISGTSAFESELMNRAATESGQRNSALKDVYLASAANNPRQSPFDPVAPKVSDQYKSTIGNLASQGASKLAKPGQYDTNNMPGLAPYKPISEAAPTTFTPNKFNPNPTPTPAPTPTPIPINNVQGATGTKPGIGQQIGNYLAPGLSIAQLIARYWSGGS